MSGSTERWTTQELELYHDGELDAQRRSELGDALRRDLELRERFVTVCRVDDELRAAFLNERTARRRERWTVSPFARHVFAAACLLMAVSLTWWFASSQRSSRETLLVERPGDSNVTVKSEYQSIRVVFSLPVERTPMQPVVGHGTEPTSAVATGTSENLRGFLARLDYALSAGRIEDTLDLLNGASEGQRTVAYRRLGELLRSAHVVEQILDRLSPHEQLAVCGLWAREPIAQPTVFERLRRFSTEPELADDVRLIVATLAEDPRLRPWLQGYQLVGDRPTRQNFSG